MRFPALPVLLALEAVFLSACQSGRVAVHRTGPRPEDLKPFVTRAGERALVTGTWGKKGDQGSLEVMRLGKDDHFRSWGTLCATGGKSFTPHGLSFVPNSTAPGWEGKSLLYAIHSDSYGMRRTVEVFEVCPGRFKHLRSLGADNLPALTAINGIAALPNGTIFLSSFPKVFTARSERAPRLESLSTCAKVPADSIVLFSPTGRDGAGKWAVYRTGWGGANGLGYSARYGVLLVAGFHKKLFHTIPVSAKTGSLDFARRRQIKLPGNPDNISELANGNWMASAVPGAFSAAGHLLWEGIGLPPIPYLLGQCRGVEVALDPLRVVASTPMPRHLTQPSTVWRDGDRFYTSRIRQLGVASWTARKR